MYLSNSTPILQEVVSEIEITLPLYPIFNSSVIVFGFEISSTRSPIL